MDLFLENLQLGHPDIRDYMREQVIEGLPEDLAERVSEPTLDEALDGLPVLVDGARAGEVTATHLNQANPYVEVALDGGRTALVPLVAPYVELTEEALELRDPPPGLLD
jgi:hypothetical protein